MALAHRDLFAQPEREWSEPLGPHLSRPTGEQLTGRRFSGHVSLLLALAVRNNIPAAGLRKVRRRLAAERGLLLTEREIWTLNHRDWARLGRREVPSFAEAFERAGTDFHVLLAESDRKL
ncbi:hypothetical protein [Antarcticirhabdus aurantiaca]|uniref:Uncharacterized protein n=1 Tax=Antarcticirhabdus aurantiaca TaxID=2606717 RepID=A0ACD4NJ83_9HYPH|nr:hypothetical protein OXU80_18695 [Jeongeuplla avenae]